MRLSSFLGSVLAWLGAVGLYMLIRFLGTRDTMDWATGPAAMIGVWIVGGLVLGTADWALNRILSKPKWRSRSFGALIAMKTAGFVVCILVLVVITRLLALAQGALAPEELMPSVAERLTNPVALAFMLYIAVVSSLLAFGRHMTGMIGGRVLGNLLLGRYRQPKSEERIFMFLDLKDSTSHAEALGHQMFSRLIQECFRDLTDSAINRNVEIYQYVGDEAILTWRLDEGLKDSNCIQVFFDFVGDLERRRDAYMREFGVMPRFKAGANVGSVTVAEIGVVKRDIAYLSDVLNTAARIQSKCNELGRDLLVAGSLAKMLPPDRPFQLESVGRMALRGREEEVEVYAVEI